MRVEITLSLALAVLMTGCAENKARHPQPSIEGLTLADLRSETAEKPAPVIFFLITTFLVDQTQANEVLKCYEKLPRGSIQFLDREAFDANGFFASRGTGMQVGPLGDCLIQAGATRLGQTNLIIEAGAEVPFSETLITQEQTIKYISPGGDPAVISLQNGILGWMLTARSDPAAPMNVHTQIQPVFTPQGLRNWPGAERYIQKMSHRFDSGRLDVSLREADFVVLGVKEAADRDLTTLEQLLFLQPGIRPKLRLYIIMCVKAEG